jgi:hypothetical protein
MNKKGLLTFFVFFLLSQEGKASFFEPPSPLTYEVFHSHIDVPLYGDFTLKERYISLNTLVVHPAFFSSKAPLSSSCPIIIDKYQATTEAKDPKASSFQGDHMGIVLEVWGYDLEDLQNPLRKQITPLDPEQGLYFKFIKPLQPKKIEIFIETRTNHNLAVKLKITTREEEILETSTKTVKIFHSTEAPSIKRSAKEYEQEWIAETH